MIRLINKNEIKELSNQIDYQISNNAFEKCYVYELNNQIIGLIDFSDIYNRLELNYIWVKPEFRNQNYSKELMNYMIDYANKKNIDNITLEVSINNTIAINLYKNYGFQKVAIRKQYYNGVDGTLMIRKFDKNE